MKHQKIVSLRTACRVGQIVSLRRACRVGQIVSLRKDAIQ